MASRFNALVTTPPGMGAGGHSWESIAEAVHKSVKTCQNWPNKHPQLWAKVYGGIERHRYEQMSKEVQTHLWGMVRDKDKRIQSKAVDLWTRHGSKCYGDGGSMVFFGTAEPGKEAKPASPNAELWAVGFQILDEEFARMNQERAKEGKPPLTQDEFVIEFNRQYDQRPVPPPVILHVDKNGNS